MQGTTAGQWLRTLREGAGRSQDDQARVLSDLSALSSPSDPKILTRPEISRWERDERSADSYWRQLIAESFGIEVADLRQLVRATRAERRRLAWEGQTHTVGAELRGRFIAI